MDLSDDYPKNSKARPRSCWLQLSCLPAPFSGLSIPWEARPQEMATEPGGWDGALPATTRALPFRSSRDAGGSTVRRRPGVSPGAPTTQAVGGQEEMFSLRLAMRATL